MPLSPENLGVDDERPTYLEQDWTHALEVEDLDAAFALLSAAPGQAVSPPGPAVQPGARFAYVKDPGGNLLELIQPPRG
jgi:predicted enzyme related to lactoylglutathione lyase